MKAIPTLNQLFSRIQANLKNKLGITNIELKAVLDALTAVLSGEFKLSYLYLADIQNNLYPDTADTAENGGQLNRMGDIYLNRQPKPATNGYYIAQVIGEENSFLRTGLTYKSNEDATNAGQMFISELEYYLSADENQNLIQIRSLETGGDSILKIGDQLTITEPVIGVDSTIEITSIINLPLQSEAIEDYRQKILDAIRLEPQGGSRTDYRLWAQDAQGVRQVYPYVKQNQAGVVQIFIEATEADSIDGKGTPSQFIIDSVQEVILFDPDETIDINARGRIPMQAIPEFLPITLRPVDVEINGLQQNNIEIRSLIEKNINLFLKDVRPYVYGADFPRNKNDILYAGKLQGVVTDSLGNNNFFNDFKMQVDGQNEASVKFSFSNIPYLRNVIYG